MAALRARFSSRVAMEHSQVSALWYIAGEWEGLTICSAEGAVAAGATRASP